MHYENPQIPEGINVSDEKPLKDFFILVAGISAIIITLLIAVFLAAGLLVKHIPFSVEANFFNRISHSYLEKTPIENSKAEQKTHQEIEFYLQNLAHDLAAKQQLPSEMSITVHYIADDAVNALATLGGNIVIFKGLLERMPSENALAMVMAHEIAHIKNRDPIVAAGRGVALTLAISSITGITDTYLNHWLSQIGLLTSLNFNRSQEIAADKDALTTLHAYYGHTGDADALFHILKSMHQHEPVTFLNSHPGLDERIAFIREFQKKDKEKLETTELPDVIKQLKH